MKFRSDKLRADVITKRLISAKMNLRNTADQIGISTATLCRLEQEKTIDIETFMKVCVWLKKEPNDYFERLTKK
jgi:DNA-binding Xre family transcriptional regulator